jgi:hypothetical protein
MMESDEDRPANLCRAVSLAVPRRRLRPDLIHRRGEGTSLQAGGVPRCPESVSSPSYTAVRAAALSAANVVPSANILCRTTASLRASATLALRIPARTANCTRLHLARLERTRTASRSPIADQRALPRASTKD